MTLNINLNAIFLWVVLMAFQGCGGGGGGGVTANTQASTDIASLNSQAIANSLTQSLLSNAGYQFVSTYAAQSEEEKAYRWLNLQRNTCGFGALKQNAMLDNSAQAHADWMLINNRDGHIESQAVYPQAFTGASVLERASYQGYINAGLAETVVSTTSPSELGWGVASVKNLLNAPYHAWALLYPFQDVGLSIRKNAETSSPYSGTRAVINIGYQVSQGLQAWDTQDVLTYPCEGSTLVSYQLANETPNPVPNRDLQNQPLGTSVIIMVKPGNELNITFASMIQVSNQKVVQLRPVVGGLSGQPSVVPNGVFYGVGSAYVAADAPLAPSESYQVSLLGTNNGNPFTKNFIFTTGPAGMLGQ